MSTAAPPPARPSPTPGGPDSGSSRIRVIGLIVVGSVVVGALGGIAGVAFDPEPTQPPPLISPADGGTTQTPSQGPSASPSGGQSLGGTAGQGLAELQPSAAPLPRITLSPGPGTGSETTQPSPAPTTGSDTGSGGAGGTAVTLSASGVDIFLPTGWSVDHQEDSQLSFSDGQGDFAFALTGTTDPSASAGDLLNANLDGLLPPDNYTQRQVATPSDLGAFGSVVSFAGTDYEALWVDNQGSATLHGQLYAAVRQDGTVLVMEIEHIPAEEWDSAFDTVEPIVVNTFRRFGGVDG